MSALTSRLGIAGLLIAVTCLSLRSEEPLDARGIQEQAIGDDDRDHWSFQPIVRPEIPIVSRVGAANNAIDYFVLKELEAEGLTLAPEADRATLLRRLKLDLLGIPPAPSELAEFLSDTRSDAYEIWVERWLASPHFGQRQAQHWLDLARFAETDGFEHDKVREGAWRYRDWVIDSINDDMPYDRFVELQLTGDLQSSPDDRIATMFCLASADMPDLNEQDVRRHDRLNEMASAIGSSLLGLQMHCAQCHDHKYDPISQADFFRLRAIFEPAVPVLKRDQPFNVFSGNESAVVARLYHRGELSSPGPIVSPGFPRIGVPADSPIVCDEQQPRVSFARWLFDHQNPLTGRVIVNRVWQHHFGRGIFPNPSDVGVVAVSPSHPELLDWLSCFLRDQQWSLKALHREILMSAVYRQSSRASSGTITSEPRREWETRLQMDEDNDLYSRFPRQRLEGEVIRDCMLAVAGSLNDQAGGQSVMPPLPSELEGTLLKGQWKTSSDEADHFRRSVYVFARRNLRYPVFDVFDRPDAGASCAVRNRSTTATQSLQMFNSAFSKQCAERLCLRIEQSQQETPIDAPNEWVDHLFRIALSRPASEAELQLLLPFTADSDSRVAACLAILNSNEFIYVD